MGQSHGNHFQDPMDYWDSDDEGRLRWMALREEPPKFSNPSPKLEVTVLENVQYWDIERPNSAPSIKPKGEFAFHSRFPHASSGTEDIFESDSGVCFSFHTSILAKYSTRFDKFYTKLPPPSPWSPKVFKLERASTEGLLVLFTVLSKPPAYNSEPGSALLASPFRPTMEDIAGCVYILDFHDFDHDEFNIKLTEYIRSIPPWLTEPGDAWDRLVICAISGDDAQRKERSSKDLDNITLENHFSPDCRLVLETFTPDNLLELREQYWLGPSKPRLTAFVDATCEMPHYRDFTPKSFEFAYECVVGDTCKNPEKHRSPYEFVETVGFAVAQFIELDQYYMDGHKGEEDCLADALWQIVGCDRCRQQMEDVLLSALPDEDSDAVRYAIANPFTHA